MLVIARSQTPSTVFDRIPVFSERRCQLPLPCPVLPPFKLLFSMLIDSLARISLLVRAGSRVPEYRSSPFRSTAF
jgi:hypothetical protein